MDLRPITIEQKDDYNRLVTHVMQSYEWGEFRAQMGIPLLRYGLFKKGKLTTAFQLTLHKIPLTDQYVGYLPKGPLPNKELAEALEQIGKEHHCAFIKVEPDVRNQMPKYSVYPSFMPSPKSLFTRFNFLLDLTPNETELLKKLHPKARYNIKVAQKKGVQVKIETSDKAFTDYLKLYFETTNRQGFYGHNKTYHQTVWNILKKQQMAVIAVAYYQKQPLTAWMLIKFQDKLYYPYGGSTQRHKEVMANNLVAWEAIRYGKEQGLKVFDMWGALGPNPDPKDPWIGFHTFKQRYGGELVEYLGTFDLIFNRPLYYAFNLVDKFTTLKVALLKLINPK